jgi:hypothetical protein
MSKISVIVLLVSFLGLVNVLITVNHRVKVIVGVLTFLLSLYYTFLDIYLFVRNPYSFWQKGTDVLLSSLLGQLYEERKSRWALQGRLRIYCNQIYSKQIMTEKASYMILIEKDMEKSENPSQHPWSKFPNGLIDSHEKRRLNIEGDERNFLREEVRTIYKEGISLMLSIRSDNGRWENEIAWEEFNISGDKGRGDFLNLKSRNDLWEKCKEHMVITMTYPVSDFRSILKAKLYKTGLFSVECKIFERWSSEEIRCYEGLNGDGLCPLFNIFYMWDYISRNPELGVVSSKKGGVGLDGRRILHCVSIEDSLSKICSGKYVLRICQHEFGGFMIAGDVVDPVSFKEVFKKKMVENFFSSPKLYKFISSYITLRYGSRDNEIIEEYVKHPSPVCFSKSVLNNWQIKRMFSDIKYIFKAMSVCHRIYCPRGIPPTKECQEVIKKITEEIAKERITELEGSVKLKEDNEIEKERVKVVESICDNKIGGLVNKALINDLSLGEDSVVRIEEGISLGLTKNASDSVYHFRLEQYKEKSRKKIFVRDEGFIKTFKNVLLREPRGGIREKLDKIMGKQKTVKNRNSECLTSLIQFRAKIKQNEITEELDRNKISSKDLIEKFNWEKPKNKNSVPQKVQTYSPVDTKNMFSCLTPTGNDFDEVIEEGKLILIEEVIDQSIKLFGGTSIIDKVQKMENRRAEIKCNNFKSGKKVVVVYKSESPDKLKLNRIDENSIRKIIDKVLSKCNNEIDFNKLPKKVKSKLSAFDIESEKDMLKYIYNRGKRGVKINNVKLSKQLLHRVNKILDFEGGSKKAIEMVDEITGGVFGKLFLEIDNAREFVKNKINMAEKEELDLKEKEREEERKKRERKKREEDERKEKEKERERKESEILRRLKRDEELKLRISEVILRSRSGPSPGTIEAVRNVVYLKSFLEYREKQLKEGVRTAKADSRDEILNRRLDKKKQKELRKSKGSSLTKEEKRELFGEEVFCPHWGGYH